MSRLEKQLSSALASRDARSIRRRLPGPTPPAQVVDFSSNDYLSLSSSSTLRTSFLNALQAAPPKTLLGAKGSRLLIPGGAHALLEERARKFFHSPSAILFNAGFDANVALFSTIPQPGDIIIADELIHASVHDGARAGRAIWDQRTHLFQHNDVHALRSLCLRMRSKYPELEGGGRSIFVAVESLYSMDGTLAPLSTIVEVLEEIFPRRNAFLIVDEAHSTGIYGPEGRGLVAHYGLEDRVFARLHTFGKALAGSGAILLVTPLVKDYIANYGRPFIFTTALAHPNVILANCTFDLLEDGTTTKLARRVIDLAQYLVKSLQPYLGSIPSHILSLPSHLEHSMNASVSNAPSTATPILPILTSHPRLLASFLLARGIDARPITWPTVPKGAERVRICIHAGNTREEVDSLIVGCVEWATTFMRNQGEDEQSPKLGGKKEQIREVINYAKARL